MRPCSWFLSGVFGQPKNNSIDAQARGVDGWGPWPAHYMYLWTKIARYVPLCLPILKLVCLTASLLIGGVSKLLVSGSAHQISLVTSKVQTPGRGELYVIRYTP